jgi:DNA-directed RNA polymerase specialized sigma24 family protein
VLRHRTVADRATPKPTLEPSSAAALLERSAVAAAMRALPARHREVLVLRYYGDLPDHEIAAVMGISRGAVKTHTARAIATLRSFLQLEPYPGLALARPRANGEVVEQLVGRPGRGPSLLVV